MEPLRGLRSGPQAAGGNDGPTPLRLLLVEDDPADAYLIQAMLEEAGVDAEWRQAGMLADVAFTAIGDWADCALVDLGLPDSQGLEAVEAILHGAPGIPVVVVSGNNDRTLALSAVREGAQDYLVKGRIEAEMLAKTIHYAIERKLIEHELQQAQQMAKVGRLAGGMAHQFNNLHAVILNYVAFVVEALPDATTGCADRWEQTRQDVEHIRQAAERAVELTRQLTTFAEQDFVRPQVIHLNDVIQGAQELLSARIGCEIALEVSLAADLPPVLADRSHVEQILVSLADNARDAMPGGGRLTIGTDSVDDADRDSAARGYARLRVHDTGTGIPSDILDRIFDPFFTTKEVGQGTGLGLAVVHGIMGRWGGRVDVESAPGVGTTVTLLIPATAPLS